MPDKREKGIKGEETALRFLKKEGYRIITQNYRSRFGEIDIIAEEDGCLVFIEVKSRSNKAFGGPFDSINSTKKRHMIQSAISYMKTNECFGRKIRFDVVGIESGSVKIIKHAFIAE